MAFISCKKPDELKIPPVLVLQGPNPYRMFTGCTYSEPGFILKDDRTPLEQIIFQMDSSSLKLNTPGSYYIHYYATDSDGNTSYARRRIIIEPFSLTYFNRTFMARDTLKPLNIVRTYPVECQVFSSEFRWVKIRNFNNRGTNFELIMNIDSIGNIQINYNVNNILINGTGTTYCDMSGFRLVYQIETPENGLEIHHVKYYP